MKNVMTKINNKKIELITNQLSQGPQEARSLGKLVAMHKDLVDGPANSGWLSEMLSGATAATPPRIQSYFHIEFF